MCVCVYVFYGLKDASLYNLICPQCEHATQPLVPPLCRIVNMLWVLMEHVYTEYLINA